MKLTILALCAMTILATVVSLPASASSDMPDQILYMVPEGEVPQELSAILGNLEPVSHDLRLLRNIAQATFCLPQNVLGILFHGLLQITGQVVERAERNELTIVITRLPIGASLGKTVFLHTSLQTENAIRHEVGHVHQGYKHGPFFLLLEGAASFTQAILSAISPSLAADYFERWPEDEANKLGGVT
ncbi:hypothetical protein IH601_03945 [Candidatus Bipolaricaulota bacterium]|nr:hypothetical protein [Candidatus Bipolaricaulota bacterium]